jgi:hypothetical protein
VDVDALWSGQLTVDVRSGEGIDVVGVETVEDGDRLGLRQRSSDTFDLERPLGHPLLHTGTLLRLRGSPGTTVSRHL